MSLFFTLFFILSLGLNVLLIWYIIKLLQKLFFVSDNIQNLLIVSQSFSEHLDTLNQKETYFGDPTIANLLEHSNFVQDEVEEFNNVFSELEVEIEYEQEEEQ